MKLGFYYHVEASLHDGQLCMPSLLGVFLDDLATRVDQLTLLLHLTTYDSKFHDYTIKNSQVRWINLGPKQNFFQRLLIGQRCLNNIHIDAFDVDLLLIRAPSPLAPALYKQFVSRMPVVFMLVGDYYTLPTKFLSPSWLLSRLYESIMNYNVLPNCMALVNSSALNNKYKHICRDIATIKTTTLKKEDFFTRKDTCTGNIKHLLYVGRYDWQKGLKELFEAVCYLKQKWDIQLHMVGWDTDKDESNLTRMKAMILELGITNNVILEGYKRVGEELNSIYKMADVFVLPSYSEGFPRCVWEAMAHSLPVVTTKVGGIPEMLTNEVDSLLVSSHNTTELIQAIEKLFVNENLRRLVIKNGYELAKDATLDTQGERIIKILQDELEHSKI